jgi:hypothetical protein
MAPAGRRERVEIREGAELCGIPKEVKCVPIRVEGVSVLHEDQRKR